MARDMIGYIWPVFILSLFVLMFFYGLIYDIVMVVIYGMVIDAGVPMAMADETTAFFYWSPVAVTFSGILWIVANSKQESGYE
ncbi:MAG: hypothetical protein WC489_09230 [Patescibacteria group bacterium]